MFSIQEYATDSLFIYILLIGSVIAFLYVFIKKKRVK
ncbi:EYxxD motif small membrane protein [Alkalihalophilus sp. As8PL]|uniref:EYxxD motif small membrane protein n=1 Tax=Alkalihalophilus sp. As8PL TaxID=3237103 RepID=A0AB39BYY1_9BACI